MASSLANFTSETQLDVLSSAIASSTASENRFIGKATFTNTSTSSVEVTLWRILISSTATSGSGGNWLTEKTILPGKTWICSELSGHALGNSMQIRALASVADVVNADISGVIET